MILWMKRVYQLMDMNLVLILWYFSGWGSCLRSSEFTSSVYILFKFSFSWFFFLFFLHDQTSVQSFCLYTNWCACGVHVGSWLSNVHTFGCAPPKVRDKVFVSLLLKKCDLMLLSQSWKLYYPLLLLYVDLHCTYYFCGLRLRICLCWELP